MKNLRLQTKRIVFDVICALIGDEDCGDILVCANKDYLDVIDNLHYKNCIILNDETYNERILSLRNVEKPNSIFSLVALYQRNNFKPIDEIKYIEELLYKLRDGGKLFIVVHSRVLVFKIGLNLRKYIAGCFCINAIIQLPRGYDGGGEYYLIEIAKNKPEMLVNYYVSSKYSDFENMLEAIRNKVASFNVNLWMMDTRWDSNYHDPKYDRIREEYLSKDTIRIGDIATIIPGIPIRESELKEKGEYFVLNGRAFSKGTIQYNDREAFYIDDDGSDSRFLERILHDGDIVIKLFNEFDCLIYHDNNIKVIPSQLFCIIRVQNEYRELLHLYFSTDLGKNSFVSQANMLGGQLPLRRLTPQQLASFCVPDIKTLRIASKMQESINLLNKASIMFESEGWEVIKNYIPSNNSNDEYDIALQLNGKTVGIVEVKCSGDKHNEDLMTQIAPKAESALNIADVSMFILIWKNAIYRYSNKQFFRILEIPKPSNYDQFNSDSGLYYDNNGFNELPSSAESVSLAYLLFNIQNEIKNVGIKVDSVQQTVNSISLQVKELADRMTVYQDLVQKQLAYAEDDYEEQEKVFRAFTDTCVERLKESLNKEVAIKQFNDEKDKLIRSLGVNAWGKMDEDSQSFLISAKVMYLRLLEVSELVDYSGVCLLVTKALELELGKRVCQNYIDYYKKTYPGKVGRENAPKPILNKYHKYIAAKDFTLGAFPFIVGASFSQD